MSLRFGISMKNNSPVLDDSPSIPFKEFRDEEIVDFFANENRTFHPAMSSSDEQFGRCRLVGTPPILPQRKGTAAFRSCAGQEAAEVNASSKTQGIFLTEKLFDAPSQMVGTRLVLQGSRQEHTEYPSVIMPFRRPEENDVTDVTKNADSSLPEKETEDIRLTRLIAIWAELPEQFKETITALLDTL